MWLDRVSNPGPLTYESGALPTALHGPAGQKEAPPGQRKEIELYIYYIPISVYRSIFVRIFAVSIIIIHRLMGVCIHTQTVER